MKSFKLSALSAGLGAVCLLGSCSLPSAPGFNIGAIDFRSAYRNELNVPGTRNVAIISDYVPDGLEVRRTRFSVGGSEVEGKARAEPLGTVYVWETANSCRDLPQGVNIPVSYEMLGANGTVLKEASLTVPKIQTCS